MKDKRIEERIQHSLNAELSGLRTTSYQRDQFFENATGGYKVKKKISVVGSGATLSEGNRGAGGSAHGTKQ